MSRRVKCDARGCGWRGMSDEVLTSTNPFDITEAIEGCPQCHTIDSVACVCDEPDCWEMVTCGTPTPDGYRSTCGDHAPWKQQKTTTPPEPRAPKGDSHDE